MPSMKAVLIAVLTGIATGAGADGPGEFVTGLAGEWSVTTETLLGPGQEPIHSESHEVARMIGGWLVAESSGTGAGGRTFTSLRTIGFDPAAGQFVATWIDSIQSRMWTYTGQLDEQGTALMLETEGPVMGNPDVTARYREVIELVDADHKVMRSLIFGPDGQWFEFARAEYRRHD